MFKYVLNLPIGIIVMGLSVLAMGMRHFIVKNKE